MELAVVALAVSCEVLAGELVVAEPYELVEGLLLAGCESELAFHSLRRTHVDPQRDLQVC